MKNATNNNNVHLSCTHQQELYYTICDFHWLSVGDQIRIRWKGASLKLAWQDEIFWWWCHSLFFPIAARGIICSHVIMLESGSGHWGMSTPVQVYCLRCAHTCYRCTVLGVSLLVGVTDVLFKVCLCYRCTVVLLEVCPCYRCAVWGVSVL